MGHIQQKGSSRVSDALVILLVGVTIAAVITPYGPFSTLKTVKLMSDPALATIDEWQRTGFSKRPVSPRSDCRFVRTRGVFRHSAAGPTAADAVPGYRIRSRAQTWAWPVRAGGAAYPRPTII